MPLITVITVVRNGETAIEQTIRSVHQQAFEEFEHIIIDGSSTDSTLQIIEKFKGIIDIIVSEPDEGIYDAMNKGITLASGKYICFINSGDLLIELPLKELHKSKEADMVCFPVRISSKKIRYPMLNWKFKITNTLPHQGIFYKKQPLLKYNLNYKVFSDYALNADYVMSKKNIVIRKHPIVANHSLDGISNNSTSSKELFCLIKDKFGIFHLVVSFIYFKLRGLYYRRQLSCF